MTDYECRALWNKAYEEGMKAGQAHRPIPMVVQQHSNMLDDNSPVKESWFVEGGVCGFAWVVVKPGTSSFARWAKREKDAKRAYYGGIQVLWVSEFGQSYERKVAFARKFAEVLREGGVKAYSESRLD